ncbi:MAG: hypothetical protein H0X31_22605 [Nostocaceae cyanobacterium]|nr:hypothetical protein [Nostocaceae cyanobacterium]
MELRIGSGGSSAVLVIKVQHINRIHICGIVAIGIVLTIPVLFCGVFSADDLLPFHLRWSKQFAEQFWSGELYPRWLMGMNAGLGSPTFFFYTPIPYYFTSLFHPLFASDPQGWHQLGLSASFALIASGITAYIWLKSITDEKSAFISSLLYMALPYHLAIDLYSRFAFAEYWTFVWLPLILYFSRKIITGVKINVVGFAVSYAFLIMTHLPILLIFSIVPISYILLMSSRQQRKKALTRIVLAMTLGVGLSAIYWLPAMTTQGYVAMSEGIVPGDFYANNFLFAGKDNDYNPLLWRHLEILTILTGGLACCAFIIARTNSTAALRRESNYWIFIAMSALFMTLHLSQPLWFVLPVLQKIQLPWRYDTILTVATTALIALGLPALKQPFKILNRNKLASAFGILLTTSLVLATVQLVPLMNKRLPLTLRNNTSLTSASILITVLILLGISALKKPVNLSNQKNLVIGILLFTSLLMSSITKDLYLEYFYKQSDVDIALQTSKEASDYRPIWVSPEIFNSDNISKLARSRAKASITGGQGSISIRDWQPRKIVLQANAATYVWLTINQFYYPGWTARLKGESHLLPVQPSRPEGLLRVGVPQGNHEVMVTLDAGVEERAGQIISAASVIIALFLIFSFFKVNQVSVR